MGPFLDQRSTPVILRDVPLAIWVGVENLKQIRVGRLLHRCYLVLNPSMGSLPVPGILEGVQYLQGTESRALGGASPIIDNGIGEPSRGLCFLVWEVRIVQSNDGLFDNLCGAGLFGRERVLRSNKPHSDYYRGRTKRKLRQF